MGLRESGLNNIQIAEMLDVDEASVRRGLRKAGFKPHLLPSYVVEQFDAVLDAPIRLDVRKDGPGAITADWHHPVTDYELVNTFIDHARDIGATNWLLVAGDWFNIDALSSFDSKQEDIGLPKELLASSTTLTKLLETFNRIVISWGNHDARVHKALGYKVPFSKAMRMLFEDVDNDLMERVELTNLDHVLIDSPRGEYLVAHPKSYNRKPLTSAIDLAAKELKHIVTGHSHHTALGHDRSATFTVAEIGGFFDTNKVQYLQRTTTHPKWQKGYGFLDRDGYLIVEGEGWSSRIGKRA